MSNPQVREQIAHVFRRCGFGPAPGAVEAWQDRGPAELIDSLIAESAATILAGVDATQSFNPPSDDDDDYEFYGRLVRWLTQRMASGIDPLAERMTWYWHTHLTSSYEEANISMIWGQHQLIRKHALGHFPTLLREVTTDAAMLMYLDGTESRGSNPNENYAREMLELFALGRDGGYTEDDVRGAARILSGWWVDWETSDVEFETEQSYTKPVTFMGERRRWTLDEFIDYVCEQPACARHVARRLYHHLVGPDLSDDRLDELADAFGSSGMQIHALVAEILRGPDFLQARHSRARQPIEWLVAARQAVGFDEVLGENGNWWLELLGQSPFLPPNVAGWPIDNRWASASQVITRTSIMLDWEFPDGTYDEVEPTVDAVLARCGIYTPSESTAAALKKIEADFSEYDGRLDLLFATALVSPEFSLL